MADLTDPALDTVEGRWALLEHTLDSELFAEACKAAWHRNPGDIRSALHYAEALGGLGRSDEMLAILQDLLAQKPHDTQINLSYGIELLMQGRYREGWPHFVYRQRARKVVSQDKGLAPDHRWWGAPLKGKSLMLVHEQGLGDTLHFIRYALDVRTSGGRVLLNAQAALRETLELNPGLGEVLHSGKQVEIHHWAYTMDAVPVFAPTRDDVRWPGVYLVPPAATGLDREIAGGPGLRIGLAWQGNAKRFKDFVRSAPLADLAPLRAAKGCRFIGLALPPAAGDIRDLGFEDWIQDASAVAKPFARLAAVIAQLDAVVTVCTSVAHLAGGMGKPVFLMVSMLPDWRWGRAGDTTPWYPSMRLYRQSRLGQWRDVAERIAADLSAL